MAKFFEVGYLTESPAAEYARKIRAAKNKSDLVKRVEYYKVFADDAFKIVKKFTDQDFKDFKRDVKKAKVDQGQEWNEAFIARFGDVIMPRLLIISEMTAAQYCAPWGCALIRVKEIAAEAKKKAAKKSKKKKK